MEPQPVENNSIDPQPVRKGNLHAIKGSKRPQNVVRLLTASEAFAAFPGLYYQRLYHMVEAGLVVAMRRRDGRTYYSEAELAEAVRAVMRTVLNSDFLGIEAA